MTSAFAEQEAQSRGLLGGGLLAVWCDVDPEPEPEFNAWYTREHVPERVGIPGFHRGRRYVAQEGGSPGTQKYLALYETESLETLASAAYLERLDNPTPWTRRMIPLFKNALRAACRVTGSLGLGVGGSLAVLRFEPGSTREGELTDWLLRTAMPRAMEHADVVGVHLCEADVEATQAKDGTEESAVTSAPWPSVRWVLLVEAAQPAGLDVVVGELCGQDGIGARGGTVEATGRYALMLSVS